MGSLGRGALSIAGFLLFWEGIARAGVVPGDPERKRLQATAQGIGRVGIHHRPEQAAGPFDRIDEPPRPGDDAPKGCGG